MAVQTIAFVKTARTHTDHL